MAILNIQLGQVGLVGVEPRQDYILTSDSVATVLAPGYLNKYEDAGYSFSQGDMVNIIVQATPTARKRAALYQVDKNGTNWNLIPLASSLLVTAARYVTVGGAASEAITITGVQATDLAFVQMVNNAPNTVSIVQAQCTANTLTVTFSGNPGVGCLINYQILRP